MSVPIKGSMRGDHEFSDERIPLAYHITFRSYGTWLHGRAGSVDRFHNRYETPRLAADTKRLVYNQSLLKQPPVYLTTARRRAILESIKETCQIRKWKLWASNIRTNHVHSVISAPCKPNPVLIALKANATRKMREAGCWNSNQSPWALRGSRDYVLYGQGRPLPE